jgi:hypothetical protein
MRQILTGIIIAATFSGCSSEPNNIGRTDDAFAQIVAHDFDAARSQLTASRQANPSDPVVLNNLAMIYALNRDFSKARELLAEAQQSKSPGKARNVVYAYVPRESSGALRLLAFSSHYGNAPVAGENGLALTKPQIYRQGQGSLQMISADNSADSAESLLRNIVDRNVETLSQ